jgi:Transposase IS4
MPPPDPRRVVGGSAWAKATHVSKDARRIYGVEVDKKWLRGTVLEVLNSRPDGSRRSTTIVKLSFKVGDSEKVKCINLAQLKRDDPNPGVEEVPAAAQEEQTPSTTTTPPSSTLPNTPPATTTNTIEPGGTTATTSTNSTGSSRTPVYECRDGRKWYDGETDLPTNGPFVRKGWKLVDQYTGSEYTPGCDKDKKEVKAIDFFMAVFPKAQLSFMLEFTNERLVREGKHRTTKGELLKFFGILILITRYEFADRASLWSPQSRCKYIPAANLGERTGMTRDRFTCLLRYVCWSDQPLIRPENMSSEDYRWKLIDGFVERINQHRSHFFFPSWLICADESISRWYGLGGHWINMGLPMYVAMDRKPEDGLEIQDACCAKSGILLQLKIVKTAEANANDE